MIPLETRTSDMAARPPQRRRHKRVAARFDLARTPADRAILLAGGTAEHLAGVLECSPSTVRNFRAPSRGGGQLPLHHREAFAAWAEAQGWALPPGFLTEHRVFNDPREA